MTAPHVEAPVAPPTPRRAYPLGAVAAVLVVAICWWVASRCAWVQLSSADGLGAPRTNTLSGSAWFGALTPLALVLLVSPAALLATRGAMRRAVGVLIALIGAATAVPAVALLAHAKGTSAKARSLAELPGRADITALHISSFPPALVVLGSVLAFGAGLWLARRPAQAGLSGKYDNPATRRAEATRQVAESGDQPVSERVLWDALDAGDDTTSADSHGDENP